MKFYAMPTELKHFVGQLLFQFPIRTLVQFHYHPIKTPALCESTGKHVKARDESKEVKV